MGCSFLTGVLRGRDWIVLHQKRAVFFVFFSGRRQDQRLVLFFKIINGLASVETEDILTPADSRTRKNHSSNSNTSRQIVIHIGTLFFTISNTRATFAYHSFCDNLRLQCTSQTIVMVCCRLSKILNYFLLRKSDVIKITRTHSMAMMMGDGQN